MNILISVQPSGSLEIDSVKISLQAHCINGYDANDFGFEKLTSQYGK
jgi:hypothetical protein